jgi:hypothetical protein
MTEGRITLLALGATLMMAGTFLLIQRSRVDGFRLWPLILVVVGLARVGTAPLDQGDEGWWLVGTGAWLLVSTLMPAMVGGAGPLAVLGIGLVTFRQALAPRIAATTWENSHVD